VELHATFFNPHCKIRSDKVKYLHAARTKEKTFETKTGKTKSSD
jgi:hypothetical protein